MSRIYEPKDYKEFCEATGIEYREGQKLLIKFKQHGYSLQIGRNTYFGIPTPIVEKSGKYRKVILKNKRERVK